MTSIIPSLKLAWPISDHNRAYAINILKQAGTAPDPRFVHVPQYAQLWACAHAGRLLGEDVSHWEQALALETDRLIKNHEEYEKERAKLLAEIAEIEKTRALIQSQLQVALAKENPQ